LCMVHYIRCIVLFAVVCAVLWCGQCMDDSLTNVVPKDQVMLHKLGGAPECHAPELAQELRAAKAEVGACTRTLLTHAHVHPLSCAWAVLVARELCESSVGIFQLQPLRHDATLMLGPASSLLNRSAVAFCLLSVVCRSVLRGCVLPSSPPMSWAPLPTASSLAAQWCRGLTCPAFQTCTLTSCTSYCPGLLPPTQVLLFVNSLSALVLLSSSVVCD
jgi:hypothetical protein